MTQRKSQAALGVTLLAMMACSLPSFLLGGDSQPTSHPTEPQSQAPSKAAGSSAECLVGTWELADLSEFMASVLPPQSEGTLTYNGTTGTAYYMFNSDRTAGVQADDPKVDYQLGGDLNLDIQVGLNGTDTADYTVAQGNLLSTTNVNIDNLAMTLTMGGMPAGDSTTLGSMVPFFGEMATATPFTCTTTTLTYTPVTEGAQAVVFTRITP
jgi:hypothetical protein